VLDAHDVHFSLRQLLLVHRALPHQHSDFRRLALLHLNYIFIPEPTPITTPIISYKEQLNYLTPTATKTPYQLQQTLLSAAPKTCFQLRQTATKTILRMPNSQKSSTLSKSILASNPGSKSMLPLLQPSTKVFKLEPFPFSNAIKPIMSSSC